LSDKGSLGNYNVQRALSYNEETKHSEVSIRAGSHTLDFSDKPLAFKVYEDALARIPLPHEFPHPESNSLDAVSSSSTQIPERVDIKTLAEVLFFSGGLTRKKQIGEETVYMRAASATGALYPIELYVVSEELPGVKASVYHFAPAEFALFF